MRTIYILGLIALAVVIIGLALADEVTLSTYYPAPYGVYKTMQADVLFLRPSDPASVTAPQDGMLICDSTDGNSIKRWDSASGDWVPLGGESLWTRSDNNVYLANTNWNVGIGTTDPQGKLHVVGTFILNGALNTIGSDLLLGADGNTSIRLTQDGDTYINAQHSQGHDLYILGLDDTDSGGSIHDMNYNASGGRVSY